MAWRTTEGEVRTVIGSDANLSIAPFIDAANVLTDKISSEAAAGVLNAAALIQIEKWLAAHFYAARDQQYQSKSTDGASATFQGQTGMGLDSTDWGQRAKLLDMSGYLKRMDKPDRPKATLAWLGLPPSEQTDYVDRD